MNWNVVSSRTNIHFPMVADSIRTGHTHTHTKYNVAYSNRLFQVKTENFPWKLYEFFSHNCTESEIIMMLLSDSSKNEHFKDLCRLLNDKRA